MKYYQAPLMKQTFKLGHKCTLKIEYWRLLWYS